jgi:ATP-dependent DNA helicase RecG
MDMRLSSPITDVAGVGPAKAKVLAKLGITHVRDLLYLFPRKYEDFSVVTPIAKLVLGKQMTVRGRVKSLTSNWGFQGRRRLLRIFAEIEDGSGMLHVTWYNLRFLEKQLPVGKEIFLAGQVELYKGKNGLPGQFSMRSPALEYVDGQAQRTHTASITPVYPETKGVTSRFLRYQIRKLLPVVDALPEYLPEDIVKRHKLLDIHQALKVIHFPQTTAEKEQAERRLRFDELFFLQLAALVRRQQWQQSIAPAIEAAAKEMESFIHMLPFTLTPDQKEAIEEIRSDMGKDQPMNRLLQGDVGSGKSAVALVAAAMALDKGFKVMYLAPTEILARQQAQNFANLLGEQKVSLLIGALSNKAKSDLKEQLLGDKALCMVGTHALLQADVQGKNVGLVIVDEQHRFGVAQRQRLRHIQDDVTPHLLSMTATPIPRTLNLTVYGDLDISVLQHLPPGRQPIVTKIISPQARDEAIIHVLEELHAGRQAYVIAPLVEQSDALELKSATAAAGEMATFFPGVAIGLMHGKLSSEDKESVMRNFAAGAIQLLVSTAVVEVGVNVPNATIMIIEGAERFGLAQLHQFRGRIGRGSQQSYCYLFPTTPEAARSERLHIIERTTDGFVIAEEDLRLRGPGEVYGVAQSGFGDLKVASLLDYQAIKMARSEAERILAEDPALEQYPILRRKVEQKNTVAHFE